MSQSSRTIPFQNMFQHNSCTALTDSLVLVENTLRDLHLVDIENISTADAKAISMEDQYLVCDYQLGYCVSEDKRTLAILSRNDTYRIFSLANVNTIEDFKQVEKRKYLFKPAIQSMPVDKMFFIANQTHLVVLQDKALLIIDLKRSKVAFHMPACPYRDICFYDETRFVSAQRTGLFVHEIQMTGQEIQLVPRKLLDGTFSKCTVSPDRKFLAASAPIPGYTDRCLYQWKINSDLTLADREIITWPLASLFTFIFTPGNQLIYRTPDSKLACRDSYTKVISFININMEQSWFPQIDLCTMPNGDLFVLSRKQFHIRHGSAYTLYRQALVEFVQAVEIGAAGSGFSSDITVLIADYSADSRFFSKPRSRFVVDNDFHRAVLRGIVKQLKNSSDVCVFDKVVLSELVEKDVETALAACEAGDASNGLAMFLKGLGEVFEQKHFIASKKHGM